MQKQIMEGALRALAIGLGSLPVAHGRFADVARRLLEVFEEFLDGRLSVRRHGIKPGSGFLSALPIRHSPVIGRRATRRFRATAERPAPVRPPPTRRWRNAIRDRGTRIPRLRYAPRRSPGG